MDFATCGICGNEREKKRITELLLYAEWPTDTLPACEDCLRDALSEIEGKAEVSKKKPVVYLLYGGHSEDGTGPGVYEGKTESAVKAVEHFRIVSNDRCSTGSVVILNGGGRKVAENEDDILHI